MWDTRQHPEAEGRKGTQSGSARARLSIIDIATIAGLLASLWFVVHNSRRRATRIKEQLAGPITPTAEPVLVGRHRKAALAGVLFAGLIAAEAASDIAHETVLAVIMILTCGAAAYGGGGSIRRKSGSRSQA